MVDGKGLLRVTAEHLLHLWPHAKVSVSRSELGGYIIRCHLTDYDVAAPDRPGLLARDRERLVQEHVD